MKQHQAPKTWGKGRGFGQEVLIKKSQSEKEYLSANWRYIYVNWQIRMEAQAIARYFGSEIPLNQPVQSVFDLIDLSREGISKKAVQNLSAESGIPISGLITIMHLSIRTWQRYTTTQRLPKEASEKVLQVAALYMQGEQVFGDLKKFQGWMSYPNPVLKNKKPLELLDTAFGFQLIQDELIRIEHGILA